MATKPYGVAIIVDPNFGERLGAVAKLMPVWIADTPANRVAAEEFWTLHPKQSHVEGVTTFRIDPKLSPHEWAAGILQAVDEHHGDDLHNPPYSVIELFGASIVPSLEEALRRLGFVHFVGREGGFQAIKSSADSGT
jgi:hypothetical protein